MPKYVAGIDAGTTGTTVMIADTAGNVVGSAYREYACIYRHPGWVEQDMNAIWTAICEASREAIAKTGVDPRDIGSLGLSSQRGTFAAIDRDWNALHDSIVWCDMRAGEEVEWIKNNIGADRFHDITGLPLSGLWSFAKFKWVMDKNPEIYEKAWKFVNGQEWFLHKLGSEVLFSDPASLTMNGMMDISKLQWSDELLHAIEFDTDKLPPISTPMTQMGVISKQAAEATGFAEGMPICSGGGDQQCAAIGSGVIREGLSEITIGTSSVMVAHVDSSKPDPDQAVFFGGHAIPHKWDMEGGASSSGVNLRWWRDTYAQAEIGLAKSMGTDPYELIGMQAEKAPVGCKGYMVFPFMTGQVTPYYVDNARGGSLGLSLIHDRSMMARAVMEGAAFELRMIVAAMEKVLGKPFDAVRLSGGGAKSPLWCQIQADMYGRPVEQLRTQECTTLGAAILGAAGAGLFAGIEEAVENMVHPFGMIEPNMSNHGIYTDMFEIFRNAFLALRDANVYNDLAAVSAKHWG
ncbi:MAG: FGGY-family carbohydrate kinase [Bacillota bacterium]